MDFFIVIIFLIMIIRILTTMKKTRSNNSSSSRSIHSGTNTTDFISTGSVFSFQDTDRNDCTDTTSNYSDSSEGSSCD
ncbi:hypothetical protein [Bacillus sp. RS11]|uniref:hypothetical protein n=1 Tax=Lysinibacillus sp. RS11 TaxID=3242682 RepID=UPI0035C703D0